MPDRQFSERLNKELDSIGLPPLHNERVDAFAKLVKVSKYKAGAILDGDTLPNIDLLNHIAEELDVNGEWLVGKSDKRTKRKSH